MTVVLIRSALDAHIWQTIDQAFSDKATAGMGPLAQALMNAKLRSLCAELELHWHRERALHFLDTHRHDALVALLRETDPRTIGPRLRRVQAR